MSATKIKIAVIGDLHYDEHIVSSCCRGDMADILLLRAVHHIGRFIRPDVVVILGDVIDNGS